MIRLIFALLLVSFCDARAQSLKDTVSNVSVVGEATQEVAPDRAILRFSVVTDRATASAAAADNARVIAAILTELTSLGVSAPDVETQSVTLAPIVLEARDQKGKATAPVQTYRASNALAVKVTPVEKAGDVVARVIEKGANQLDGVDYDFSDLSGKRDALRAKAVGDAERRARIYAEAVGLRLARVLEIRPLDAAGGPEPLYARAAAAPASTSVPLRAPSRRVTERVAITWALSR
jgi:uncharacterized protein YggE